MMSRTGVSDVLVVSVEVTSNNRMIGRAPCQSWRSAASARCTDWCVSSQVACSQYGSGTIRKMRSLVKPPMAVVLPPERSFSMGMVETYGNRVGCTGDLGGRAAAGFEAAAGAFDGAAEGAGALPDGRAASPKRLIVLAGTCEPLT